LNFDADISGASEYLNDSRKSRMRASATGWSTSKFRSASSSQSRFASDDRFR
jgi:hypothetical protein